MTDSVLRVLTYHRVLDPADLGSADPKLISATPEAFERQMRVVAQRYRAVSAEEVLTAVRERRPLPPRAVMITFDDAYRDLQEVAWPILRRLELPATVFVPSAFPGDRSREFWWDRLHRAVTRFRGPAVELPGLGAYRLDTPRSRAETMAALRIRLKASPHAEAMALVDRVCDTLEPGAVGASPVLEWTSLRELSRSGLTLGAHTRNHPALDRLGVEEIRAEVRQGRADLEREVGPVAPIFAYPYGAHDARVVEIVRQEGFELGFTCLDGHNPMPFADPLRLRRTNITMRTSPLLLRLRLRPFFGYVDAWRHRDRRNSPSSEPVPPHEDAPTAPLATHDHSGSESRIAYVMSRFPKLTETFVLYEILALERMGVGVEIYPLLRGDRGVMHPEAARLMARARYRPFVSPGVIRAQLHFLRSDPRRYTHALAEAMRENWGNANRFLGAIAIFPKSVTLAYEMKLDGIRHVHAHFVNHPTVAAFIIQRLTGIPYSFTAHGSDLHTERRMLRTKVEAAAFAVTVSEYNRELIVSECGERARAKVHVVHCGVDPEVFAPSRRRTEAQLQVVCVASFEEVKGHRYLIEACRHLRERGVPFVCHLVGDGPLRREMTERIARVGLENRIRVHGPLPRPAVVRLLSRSDVAVLASHLTSNGKREGIPVALMEAMASGLPVVASEISGIPELVRPGCGILVPPEDAAALARALETLAADPALRRGMGDAARQAVLHEFDLRKNAADLVRLFMGNAETPVVDGAAPREELAALTEPSAAPAAIR